MDTFSVWNGIWAWQGSGNSEKNVSRCCLCFQTLPAFGQQPGYPSLCSQMINFILVLFVLCCLSPTSLTPAELGKRGKFKPGIGKTFPAWKPSPGQNGAFGIEGKNANPKNVTKSLEAKLPEAFATHKALVHEGAARGFRRDLWGVEINGLIQHFPGFNTQPLPSAFISCNSPEDPAIF